MEKSDIVFIEYDGKGKPFQVYLRDLTGYDFFVKDGILECNWCSSNIRPFLSKRAKANTGRKHNVWFIRNKLTAD